MNKDKEFVISDEIGVTGVIYSYAPYLFSGKMEEANYLFEGGVIPREGDTVSLVCYEAEIKDGKFTVKCRWKVDEKNK